MVGAIANRVYAGAGSGRAGKHVRGAGGLGHAKQGLHAQRGEYPRGKNVLRQGQGAASGRGLEVKTKGKQSAANKKAGSKAAPKAVAVPACYLNLLTPKMRKALPRAAKALLKRAAYRDQSSWELSTVRLLLYYAIANVHTLHSKMCDEWAYAQKEGFANQLDYYEGLAVQRLKV